MRDTGTKGLEKALSNADDSLDIAREQVMVLASAADSAGTADTALGREMGLVNAGGIDNDRALGIQLANVHAHGKEALATVLGRRHDIETMELVTRLEVVDDSVIVVEAQARLLGMNLGDVRAAVQEMGLLNSGSVAAAAVEAAPVKRLSNDGVGVTKLAEHESDCGSQSV